MTTTEPSQEQKSPNASRKSTTLEPLTEKSIHFYCINLKHRTDRWTAFSQQSAIQDIKRSWVFERFDAVAGSTVDIQADTRISMRAKRNIKQKMRRDHEDINTVGAIGAYLSHTEIWKRVLNNSEPYAIVFEDDASVPADFLDRLKKAYLELNLLDGLPDIWAFSYPWSFYYRTKGRSLPQDIPENLRGNWILNSCPGGLGGYFITKEGAKKLLENAFPIDMHVDLYMCLCVEMKKVQCVSNRAIVLGGLSESAKSDIQLPSGCAICDVPTDISERGLTIINMPIVVCALFAMAGLAWVTGGKGRGR